MVKSLFAKNIKYIFRRFKLTQAQLALQVNKRQTTISNWIKEISQPDVNDITAINQFIGISIDHLLLTDLEKDNPITDEQVRMFMEKGSLSSNSNVKKGGDYNKNGLAETVAKEGEALTMWVVMNQLKQLDEKIDRLQVSVNKLPKRK